MTSSVHQLLIVAQHNVLFIHVYTNEIVFPVHTIEM